MLMHIAFINYLVKLLFSNENKESYLNSLEPEYKK